MAVEKVNVKEVIMKDLDAYKSSFRSWGINAFLNTSWIDNPSIKWFGTRIREALDEVRNDKPIVVGVCGNMGTGKNAAVEFFTKLIPSLTSSVLSRDNVFAETTTIRSTELAFADPIREIGKLFGFTMEQMTDRTLKETVDPRWGVSPRTFMQKVGTEMFRDNLCQDVWVKLALQRIEQLSKPYEVIIGFPHGVMGTRHLIFVTDVRFPNEAEAIKSIGGHVVKIRREGFDKKGADLHPSERFINDMPCDLEVFNKASSLEEWQWEFAKRLTQYFKQDAFYEINKKWDPETDSDKTGK